MIQPVEFAFGGFAIYDSRILKETRFKKALMYDFNADAKRSGARFAVVPWMVNSGQDKFYLGVIIVCLLGIAVLFILLT